MRPQPYQQVQVLNIRLSSSEVSQDEISQE